MTAIELSDTTTSFKDLTQKVANDNAQSLVLTNVEIQGSEDDMLSFANRLRGHPSLKTLVLKNVKAENSLDQPISSLFISAQSLESAHIEGTPVASSAVSTAGYCASLKSLKIPNNNYNDADATSIADALASSSSLKELDLSNNKVSDVGCKALERCLEKNSQLAVVRLDGNGISGAEFSKLEAKLVGRAAVAA